MVIAVRCAGNGVDVLRAVSGLRDAIFSEPVDLWLHPGSVPSAFYGAFCAALERHPLIRRVCWSPVGNAENRGDFFGGSEGLLDRSLPVFGAYSDILELSSVLKSGL